MGVSYSKHRGGWLPVQIGSFLVQELKRICYEQGSIPAARYNVDNTASQLTLQREPGLCHAETW